MKKINLFAALLLALVLAAGCAQKDPLDLIDKPEDTQATAEPAVTPDPAAGTEPVASGEELTAPVDTEEPGNRAYGRWAVTAKDTLYRDAFYFVNDQKICAYKDGTIQTLCDVPEDGNLSTMFISDSGMLYFTINVYDKAETTHIYRINSNARDELPEFVVEAASWSIVNGQTIYYMKDSKLMSLYTPDNTMKEITDLGEHCYLSSIFHDRLYYSQTIIPDNGNMDEAISRLYRLTLTNLSKILLKENSNTSLESEGYIISLEDLIYQIAPSGDGIHNNLRILDSSRGGSDTIYTIDLDITGENGLYLDKLFQTDDALYMLLSTDIYDTKKDEAKPYNLRLYKFTQEAPEAALVWDKSLEYNFYNYNTFYDPINQQIVAYANGDREHAFRISTFSLADGSQTQFYEGPQGNKFLDPFINKSIINMGSRLSMFYDKDSNNAPNSPGDILVYYADLANIANPIYVINGTAE